MNVAKIVLLISLIAGATVFMQPRPMAARFSHDGVISFIAKSDFEARCGR